MEWLIKSRDAAARKQRETIEGGPSHVAGTGEPMGPRRHLPAVIGPLLLLLALCFYYIAVLSVDFHRTGLLDLDPQPDAVEYFSQAHAMAAGWRPHIQIGYDILPSRYPLGYPVLMVPWLKVLPSAEAILAPFRTNQTAGALLIVGAFLAFALFGAPLEGGCAALLMATLPGLVTYCRSPLSEVTACAFIATAFFAVYIGLVRQKRAAIYVGALLLGLSLNIRMQSVFFGPLLLAMALMPMRHSPARWFLHCVGALVVFGIAASPFFILNTIQFGAPLRTGYDFWVPWHTESSLPFALRNVPVQARMLWAEFSLTRQSYSVANIFGTGTHFVPAFSLLACAGLVLLPRSRFSLCAVLAGLTFLAATLSYSFVDCRFYLPLLVLLVPLAVLPVSWAARALVQGPRFVGCVVLAVFAAACVGYPSQSGYKPKQGRSQAWDAVTWGRANNKSPRFLAQQHLASAVQSEPAIVLSDIDSVYLNTLSQDFLVAAPIDVRHSYRFSKIWRYDAQDAVALLHRATENGIAAYALFQSASEMGSAKGRLPTAAGFDWVVHSESPAGVILKLLPAGSY